MAKLRWQGSISAWDIGCHYDGWAGSRLEARVVRCRTLERLPIIPHPNGRRRYLYLALIPDKGIVGVYRSLRKAQRECELYVAGKHPNL